MKWVMCFDNERESFINYSGSLFVYVCICFNVLREVIMKNLNKIIWGLLFIFIGIVVLLNSLGVMTINLFFDGWWTLFIIVPSVIGLINDDDKTGNIIGLIIGILLLLSARDILDWGLIKLRIVQMT